MIAADLEFATTLTVILTVTVGFALLRIFLKIEAQRKSLMATEERLRMIIDSASAGVWDWNLKTNGVVYDGKFRSQLGFEEHELSNDFGSFQRLCHPDDFEKVMTHVDQFLKGIIPKFYIHIRMRTKNGTYRWILSEATAKFDLAGRPARMVGWHRDITDQRIAAEVIEQQRVELANAAKMAAFGEMSGGIAHEINNPLAIIHGAATRISLEVNKQSADLGKIEGSVTMVLKTVDRISKVLSSMQNFSRDSSQDPLDHVPVDRLITETLEMCRSRLLSMGIQVLVPDTYPAGVAYCRQSEIMQVMINLLSNASDAVESVTEKWIRIEVQEGGQDFFITVQDSGTPMSRDIITKIFRPFFTTKQVGRGTGLGLSISKSLMSRNGGDLYFKNDSSLTTFVMRLPKLSYTMAALIPAEAAAHV